MNDKEMIREKELFRFLFWGVILSAVYICATAIIQKSLFFIAITLIFLLLHLIYLKKKRYTGVMECFYLNYISFSFKTKKDENIFIAVLIFLLILAAVSNLNIGSDLPYWHMDNGAFMGRYVNFYKAFPSLAYYDPFWQAGQVTYESFRSGIIAIFIIFNPFLQPGHIDFTYRFIAPIILVFIPLSIFVSARLAGMKDRYALCAAAFALIACTQGNWFSPVNGLKSGVYPFVLTSSIFPLIICTGICITEKRTGLIKGLMFLCFLFMIAISHPTFLIMIMGLFAFLFFWMTRKKIYKIKSFKKYILIIGSLSVFLAMAIIFSGNLNVLEHLFHSAIEVIKSNKEAYSKLFQVTVGDKRVFDKIIIWLTPRFAVFIPVLILGGIQIYYWIKTQPVKGIYYLFSAGWLLILGWFGSFFLFGAQPVRFVAPAALLLVIPFSNLWCRTKELAAISKISKKKEILFSSAILIIACNSVFLTQNIFGFVKMSPPRTLELKQWLEKNVKPDARIFIDLDGHHGIGGMPKRLQQVTGLHFIGDQAFNPEYKRKLEKRMHELFSYDYFKTYNVHLLLVTTKEAQNYIEDILKFKSEKEFGRVKAYLTGIDTSFFAKGSGDLTADVNKIDISAVSPLNGELVLRFHYEKGITASPGVEVFPVKNKYDKDFIGIKPNRASHVTLFFGK